MGTPCSGPAVGKLQVVHVLTGLSCTSGLGGCTGGELIVTRQLSVLALSTFRLLDRSVARSRTVYGVAALRVRARGRELARSGACRQAWHVMCSLHLKRPEGALCSDGACDGLRDGLAGGQALRAKAEAVLDGAASAGPLCAQRTAKSCTLAPRHARVEYEDRPGSSSPVTCLLRTTRVRQPLQCIAPFTGPQGPFAGIRRIGWHALRLRRLRSQLLALRRARA